MTDAELIATATAFDVGPEAFINGHLNFKRAGKYYWTPREGEEPREVEYRYHVQVKFTGSKWVITNGISCLNKTGEWEYPPQPSSQDDDFRDRIRFDTPREAIAFFQRHRSWEWDIYEQIKESHTGRALWEELERRMAEKYKQLQG